MLNRFVPCSVAAYMTLSATMLLPLPAAAHLQSSQVVRNGVTFDVSAHAAAPTGGSATMPPGGTPLDFDSDFSYKISHDNTAPQQTYEVAWASYLDSLNSTPVAGAYDLNVTVGPGEFTNTRNRHADAEDIWVQIGNHWRYALIRIVIQGNIEAQQLDDHSFTVTAR